MGCKLWVTTTSPFTDMLKTIYPQSRVAAVITMTSAEAMSYKQHDIKEQQQKKKIKLQQIRFNGSRQMRRWGAKDGEGAVGMTVQFAVHREGLLGWKQSHRLVGWDYCPVSALYDHTHMHAHNWRTHILRVKTERGGWESRAGGSGSCGFRSASLSSSLCTASRLYVSVCVMSTYKVWNGPCATDTSHPPLFQLRWSCGLVVLLQASHARGGSQLVEQDIGVAATYLTGGHWRYSGQREGQRSDMLRNRRESGVHNS